MGYQPHSVNIYGLLTGFWPFLLSPLAISIMDGVDDLVGDDDDDDNDDDQFVFQPVSQSVNLVHSTSIQSRFQSSYSVSQSVSSQFGH